MKNQFKLLDIIALKTDVPGLRQGSVGTIVDIPSENVYLVEFSGSDGVAYAIEEIEKKFLLKLHFDNQAALA